MDMAMQVIVVIVENRLLMYADWYRVYADTDECREKALEWAKQNGYDSMIGPTFEVGVLNQYRCGDINVKIICQEVRG
jgi:hypothetical protein